MLPFLDLKAVNALHGEEIQQAVTEAVTSGWYLHGNATEHFERQYANYIGTRHAIACANGLDALSLILRAYKEMGQLHDGDEVIVPANTFIATVLAITGNRLTPIFVEPSLCTLGLDDTLISRHITPRTRAIMLVHLYGRCAYTERIGRICTEHNLLLIEDNAQAHGCQYAEHRTGSLGHAAAHSFYPGKNLGALGDAGCVTTDDAALAQMIRALGNYGMAEKYVCPVQGRNSRMDELQAAVLSVKLRHLDEDNACRQRIADIYYATLPQHILPARLPHAQNVCHLFPIFLSDKEERDQTQKHLLEMGVQTLIHYPIPPHRQQCYSAYAHLSLPLTERLADCELSLPISPAMSDHDIQTVVNAVNKATHATETTVL